MNTAGLRWPTVDPATVLAGAQPAASAAVLRFARWSPAELDALSAEVWARDLLLLPVRVDGHTTLVGPLLHPGAPACLGCVEVERLATIGGATPRREPDLRLGGEFVPAHDGLVDELATAALADPAGHAGLLWAIRADGSCATHHVSPRRAGCAVCAPLGIDRAEDAGWRPAPRPMPDPYRLRADNPRTTLARLRAELHDWRLGPVAHVSRREQQPIALAHAEVTGDWTTRDGGYGRASTFADAERVALFEAVERMAGLGPLGRRTALCRSFAELGPDRALDPATLGRHEPAALAHPAFTLTPYTPDTPLTWVYGSSLGTGRVLAVPEQVAYWGRPRAAGSAQILRESSNGCGLGNSLEEAALYGLLEVAERDAFLMAWYARTPLARVAPPAEDRMVAHLADQLDALGYDLLLFDATNDFGVPVVISLATCRDTGSPAPQAFFSAAAHPQPAEAIRSAVVEVAVNIVISVDLARERPDRYRREYLRTLLADPYRINTPDEHVALYSLPQTRSRYDFLDVHGDAAQPWQRCWPDAPPRIDDLGGYLTAFVDRVAAAGMDVIVVDQSDPRLRERLGLHAAKVIVPGAVPLVFGHGYRRTRGLPRLLDVPVRLGRLPSRPDYDTLPLDPHPFP